MRKYSQRKYSQRKYSQRKKSQDMKNPFKFGSVVDAPYFIDRLEEIRKVKSILVSENHPAS